MGGCGGNKSSGKSSSPAKSMPKNWGGMKAPKSISGALLGSANSFGQPKVKTSFSGRARR